jgi:hypothetical protein
VTEVSLVPDVPVEVVEVRSARESGLLTLLGGTGCGTVCDSGGVVPARPPGVPPGPWPSVCATAMPPKITMQAAATPVRREVSLLMDVLQVER